MSVVRYRFFVVLTVRNGKKKLYASISVQNVAVTLIAKGFAEETFLLAYRNESLEAFFSENFCLSLFSQLKLINSVWRFSGAF